MRSISAWVALGLVLTGGRISAQRSLGKVTNLQVPQELALRSAMGGDLDGDGLVDLLLFASDPDENRPFRRFVRIHLRHRAEPPFAPEPDAILEVLRDVVACAIADVLPAPGEELLLFTARAVFAWRLGGAEKERYTRLCESDFLWQLPRPRKLLDWRAGVLDLDGDGLADLFVPEPDGYRLVLQRRAGDGGFPLSSVLELPDEVLGDRAAEALTVEGSSKGAEIRLRLQKSFSSGPAGPLLEVRDEIPAPCFCDWDGDGDLDVLAQSEHHLHIWLQNSSGSFPTKPGLNLALPFAADRKRRFDLFYSARIADLDRDGKADAVFFAGDKRSKDLRTQILVFIQGKGRGRAAKSAAAPLFGPHGIPQQLMVIAGALFQPRLEDFDGDGLLDLSLISLRLDLADALRSTKAVDVELYVFLNHRGIFSRRPDLVHRARVRADDLQRGGSRLSARFVSDLSGDHLRDLLVRSRPEVVSILVSHRRRGGLSILDRPLWEMRVDRKAQVEILEIPGGAPELLVRERGQLLHVRFR